MHKLLLITTILLAACGSPSAQAGSTATTASTATAAPTTRRATLVIPTAALATNAPATTAPTRATTTMPTRVAPTNAPTKAPPTTAPPTKAPTKAATLPPAAPTKAAPSATPGRDKPGRITEIALVKTGGEVMLLRPDGEQKVYTLPFNAYPCTTAGCEKLDWSPNGWRLATAYSVLTFSKDPAQPPQVAPIFGYEAHFSPDGEKVAWSLGIPPPKDSEGNYIGDDAITIVAGDGDGDNAKIVNVRGGVLAATGFGWNPDGTLDGVPISGPTNTLAPRDPDSAWARDGKREAFIVAPDVEGAAEQPIEIGYAVGEQVTPLTRLPFTIPPEDLTTITLFNFTAAQPRWLPNDDGLLVPIDLPEQTGEQGTWKVTLDGTTTKLTPHVLINLHPDGQRFLAYTVENHIVEVSARTGELLQDLGIGITAAYRPTVLGPAPTAPLAAKSPTLRRGVAGQEAAVKEVQQLLKDLGYDVGEVDGIFGSGTETAVRAFQTEVELETDGIVGPRTWAALRLRLLVMRYLERGPQP